MSWKMIQKSLPNLAAQIAEDDKAPEGQAGLYKSLANARWWQENVVPNFALSKADTKDLAGISKDFDSASTTILSLTVNAGGPTKESAIDAVTGAAQFLRSGGAYLQIRNMLNGYEGDTISAAADIQKRITSTQIEMGYQQQRAKALEDLYKKYPTNSSMGQQVVDPKESGAKYLSITTQIIAANNDINQSKEVLNRMRDRLDQIAITKTFLAEAIPEAGTTFDGLTLSDKLIAIEIKLRSTVDKSDPKQQEILDQIHSQLLMIQARFTKGLEANTAPTSGGKKGLLKSTAGGLAAGFFLMFLALLGQRVWQSIKGGGTR